MGDYKEAGEIVDDEMNALLVQHLPRGACLTAIFDSCHSATALDLPFVYDSYGQPKKQKYSRKTAGLDLLQSGLKMTKGNIFDKLSGAKQAFGTLSALGNEGNAQEITAETRSTQADVVMFSGCKDYQTSADTNVSGFGATGAASFAFVNTITGESKWSRHDVHGVVGNHEGDIEGQIRAEDSDVHRLPNRYEHSLHLLSRGVSNRHEYSVHLLASPFRPEAFAALLVVRNTGDHETKHITPIFFLRFFLRKSFYVFMLFLCAKEQHKLGWQSFSFYNQILLRTNLLSTRIF